MHFSGCSAVCAQPQIADIGFRGDIAHVGEHIEEAVDIGLGGSLGPDAGVHRLGGRRGAGRPASPTALAPVSASFAAGPPARRALLRVGPPDRQRRAADDHDAAPSAGGTA